jgi:hypothetical protein
MGLLGGLLQVARERYRAMEAKIEREEQKEEAAWEAWKSRSQTLAAQRAEQQRQQTAAAYQAYRQGERCFLLQNLQAPQAALDTLPPSDYNLSHSLPGEKDHAAPHSLTHSLNQSIEFSFQF